jgi:hypothetical protein
MSEATDYGNLSDEEFLEAVVNEETGVPDMEYSAKEATEETDDGAVTNEAEEEEDTEVDSASDGGEADGEGETTEGAESSEDEAGEEAESEGDVTDEKKETSESSEPDYADFYSQITKPFKANGKEFKVDNPADAIQLMQMGINYNKKMAALKPSLKSIRLLERHGLLDENKLSFLIDLERKDPKAIAKLLQDSKLDPMEIDVEEGSKYSAPVRTVDDREMELNSVLDDLKESPKYASLLDTVSNVWDRDSRKLITDQPQVLNVLHEHMVSGVYDVINEAVQRERTFGRLKGMTDLEAYRQVGDDLHAKGGFNHLFPEQGAAQNQGQQGSQRKIIPKKDVQKDTTRSEKRRAASATKATINSGKPRNDINPLAMSDEEFMKTINPHFL